jgi:hypothetical protein
MVKKNNRQRDEKLAAKLRIYLNKKEQENGKNQAAKK